MEPSLSPCRLLPALPGVTLPRPLLGRRVWRSVSGPSLWGAPWPAQGCRCVSSRGPGRGCGHHVFLRLQPWRSRSGLFSSERRAGPLHSWLVGSPVPAALAEGPVLPHDWATDCGGSACRVQAGAHRGLGPCGAAAAVRLGGVISRFTQVVLMVQDPLGFPVNLGIRLSVSARTWDLHWGWRVGVVSLCLLAPERDVCLPEFRYFWLPAAF